MGVDGRTPRWGTARALLITVALLAGACTDGDDEPARTTTTTTRPGDEVVEGGRVRLALGAPVQPDPTLASSGSPAELMVLDLLHDGLTRMGADGTVRPALARAWHHDGTTWTFELDPAATFASGAPVTNATVVASLERLAKAGPRSLAALRLETVAGFDDFVSGATPNLAGLVAAADGTVQISLVGPVASLPAILASPELGIVDGASLQAATTAGDLSGLDLSGSWAVDESTAGTLALRRRAERPGHLDGIDLQAFDDPAAAYQAFKDGDVDWALVPAADHDDAVDAYGDDHFAPYQAEIFLGLRVAAPALTSPDMRVAIAAAIDREAIVEEVYGDRADPLATIVPAGVPGRNQAACGAEACRFDPAVAKQALARAFPDGAIPTVHLDFDESPTQRQLAELVAAELGAVGIPTELRAKPRQEYETFIASGAQELFSFGWIGGYAAPAAYLVPLFASLADDNLTGVASPDVDAALAAAWATDDQAISTERWGAAEALLLSQAIVIPVAQFRTQAVVADRVHDLAHAVDGSVDWARVWVEDGAG
ncbi:MAG TPA: ABC transporter substrate-binding protein [Acidimicrobiales bacterium]|nr:ABC transporter substrate-binding protein [Acidimicrobiales bacterium]